MRREIYCSPATTVVTEAKTLADFLIEWERGQGTPDIENAIHRAATRWGIDDSALKSLRYRSRDLQDVKASLLERLREAYEDIYERQRRTQAVELEIEATLARVREAETV
jgi:hypothetical protein